MSANSNQLYCCGITELDGVQAGFGRFFPKSFLMSVAEGYGCEEAAFYIFSTAGGRTTRGEALAKYITENKLGTVAMLGEPNKNPNTGRLIKAWAWRVDQKAWEAWREQYVPKEQEGKYNDWW